MSPFWENGPAWTIRNIIPAPPGTRERIATIRGAIAQFHERVVEYAVFFDEYQSNRIDLRFLTDASRGGGATYWWTPSHFKRRRRMDAASTRAHGKPEW